MKPIKIYTNQQQLENVIADVEKNLQTLNDAVKRAENITNNKLDNYEANRLKEEPTDFLTDWVNVTNDVAFALSPIDFKLDSRGLRSIFYDFVEFAQPKVQIWNTLDTVYQNNQFQLKKEVYEKIKNDCSLFITTETAKAEYDFLITLANHLNVGFEKGYLNINTRPQIVNSIHGLKLDVLPGHTDFSIIVNPYSVLDK